jgi:hypothetical protein
VFDRIKKECNPTYHPDNYEQLNKIDNIQVEQITNNKYNTNIKDNRNDENNKLNSTANNNTFDNKYIDSENKIYPDISCNNIRHNNYTPNNKLHEKITNLNKSYQESDIEIDDNIINNNITTSNNLIPVNNHVIINDKYVNKDK